jgi:hypothetical protein
VHHILYSPFPLCRQYVYTIRDDQTDLLDALIHFLRFLYFLRNLSLEIASCRRVAGSGQGQPPAMQEWQ